MFYFPQQALLPKWLPSRFVETANPTKHENYSRNPTRRLPRRHPLRLRLRHHHGHHRDEGKSTRRRRFPQRDRLDRAAEKAPRAIASQRNFEGATQSGNLVRLPAGGQHRAGRDPGAIHRLSPEHGGPPCPASAFALVAENSRLHELGRHDVGHQRPGHQNSPPAIARTLSVTHAAA